MPLVLGAVVHFVRLLDQWLLFPFDHLPPRFALVLISVLTGIGTSWVFGKTTDQQALSLARDQMSSAVYEIRLYLDSPRRIVSAQAHLLRWSLRYLIHTLPAVLILLVPMSLLFLDLEARFGLAPLPTNAPLLVKVSLAPLTQPGSIHFVQRDRGVRLTAPPLYDAVHRRLYVRVELEPGIRAFTVEDSGRELTKRLVGDERATGMSPQRARGLAALWSTGDEAPLPASFGVDLIEVDHPSRKLRWLGFDSAWWLSFLALSSLTAVLLRKRMGVVV